MIPFRWYGLNDDLHLLLVIAYRTIKDLRVVAGHAGPRKVRILENADQALSYVAKQNDWVHLTGTFSKPLGSSSTGRFDHSLPSILVEGPVATRGRKPVRLSGLPPNGTIMHRGMVACSHHLRPGLEDARKATRNLVSSLKRALVPAGDLWVGPFGHYAVMSGRAVIETPEGVKLDRDLLMRHC